MSETVNSPWALREMLDDSRTYYTRRARSEKWRQEQWSKFYTNILLTNSSQQLRERWYISLFVMEGLI